MPLETYKLYGGKVTLKFDPAPFKHIYTVDKKVKRSVTGITKVINKPALMYWAVNMAVGSLQKDLKPGVKLDEVQIKEIIARAKSAHRKRRDKSADIGTMIHDWVEKFIRAGLEKEDIPKKPINPEMRNAINGFFKWTKKNKVKFLAAEQKIYSRKYDYAGTLDIEAMKNGKRGVVDLKTGKAIYAEHFLQAVAYLKAREEELKKKFTGGITILRVSQANKAKGVLPFEAVTIPRNKLNGLFNVFLACDKIAEWQDKEKQEKRSKKK